MNIYLQIKSQIHTHARWKLEGKTIRLPKLTRLFMKIRPNRNWEWDKEKSDDWRKRRSQNRIHWEFFAFSNTKALICSYIHKSPRARVWICLTYSICNGYTLHSTRCLTIDSNNTFGSNQIHWNQSDQGELKKHMEEVKRRGYVLAVFNNTYNLYSEYSVCVPCKMCFLCCIK